MGATTSAVQAVSAGHAASASASEPANGIVPPAWELTSDPWEVVIADVPQNEFDDVSAAFLETMSSGSVHVVSVQRIQNLALWKPYVAHREAVASISNRGD